jgi:hypothetical protein
MQFRVTTADEVETSYDGMYEVESNGVEDHAGRA